MKHDLLKLASDRMEAGRLQGKDPNDGRDFKFIEFPNEIADAFNYSLIQDLIKGTNTWITRLCLKVVWRVWFWETRKAQ